MTDLEGSVGGMLGLGLTAVTGAVVVNTVGNMLVKAAGDMKKSTKPKKKYKRKSK